MSFNQPKKKHDNSAPGNKKWYFFLQFTTFKFEKSCLTTLHLSSSKHASPLVLIPTHRQSHQVQVIIHTRTKAVHTNDIS